MTQPRPTWVTGGAGFIGSQLVRELLGADPGQPLVVIDALTYAADKQRIDPMLQQGQLQLIELDVCDDAALTKLAQEAPPATVYHLAAETHVDKSIDDPEAFLHANVRGTVSLLTALLRAAPDARVLAVSTDEVLGPTPEGEIFSEEARHNPHSPYAASKAAGELLALSFARTYEQDIVVVRPTNVYGPRQLAEKLIPLMISRALLGQSLPLYGDGRQRRDWLYVADAARGLRLAAEHGRAGEVYHLAGGNLLENLQVVRAIERQLALRAPSLATAPSRIEHVRDRPAHDRQYCLSDAKLRELTGFEPDTDFETGLAQTIDYFAQPDTLARSAAHLTRQG